jgi:hypothetical protein
VHLLWADKDSDPERFYENLEERKMFIVRKTLIAFVVLVTLSVGTTVTQGQRQNYRGTFRSVRQLILRIESGTEQFSNSLNGQNQSRVYGRGSVNVNLVQDLKAAVTELRIRFDRRETNASDVQQVLDRAALIDRFMGRNVRDAVVQRHWTTLRSDLNQLATVFNQTWPPSVGQTYPNPNYPTSPVLNSSSLLTGTYRLDSSNSDDPRQAAAKATQTLPYRNRNRLRDELASRLDSPDQIALDLRGRDVTIASSRAPQISFSADGAERIERTSDGRTIRARALLNGDQLIVSSTGDRATEFNVTFNPIDNGRRLSVTRRVYVQGVSRPVVVQSTYDKVSEVARFDINTGSPTYPSNGNDTDFVVQDGETVVGVLNDGLSTQTAREGDRFTLTVRQPSQFEGATIEGHVSSIRRSGRITGRSEVTLNFDRIQLRNGRSYPFAGIVESVRTTQGDVVRVDNEGAVRDDNQTTKTAQRAAIGTAVGAIIGAIAGGGKGAAIGAVVGAGGGAGSVYVQGRDDLELVRGSELTIRASGPR